MKRAKVVAIARNVTLKSLIQSGLEREIGEPSPAPRHPLRVLRTLDGTIWKDVQGDDYVSDLRKSWD